MSCSDVILSHNSNQIKKYYSNKIYISIIITVFNGVKYITNAVSSLYNGDFVNFELICIDDGSTDNSYALLKKCKKKYKNLKIFQQPHVNAGVGRNLGLRHAKGEYLLFLDIDDIYTNELIKNFYYAIFKYNFPDIIICNYKILKDTEIVNNCGYPKESSYNIGDNLAPINTSINKVTNPSLWNKIFKHSFVKKYNIKCQNINTCNDIGFTWTALLLASSIFFINKELITYRSSRKNSISSKRNLYSLNIIKVLSYISVNKNIKSHKILYESGIENSIWEYKLLNIKKDKLKFENKLQINLPQYYFIKFLKHIYKVSIIIPVYNTYQYLEDCLNSVCNQTLKDIEILIINDKSTDNSDTIIKKFENKDNRIRVINNNTNLGLARSRNLAIKEAKGEFIFFLDSDDLIELNLLEILYNIIKENKSDIVLYGIKNYDEKEKKLNKLPYVPTRKVSLIKNENFIHKNYEKMIFSRFESVLKLYSKEFFINNNLFFDNLRFGEDVLTHVKSMILAKNIYYYDDFMYIYRINRPCSLMNNSITIVNISNIIDFIKKIKLFLIERGIFEKLKVSYYNFISNQKEYYLSKSNKNSIFDELFKKEIEKL